jgi:hypothetical protein
MFNTQSELIIIIITVWSTTVLNPTVMSCVVTAVHTAIVMMSRAGGQQKRNANMPCCVTQFATT